MGNVVQWRRFEAELGRLKAVYGFKIFHAKDFRHRSGEFRGWDDGKCVSLSAELCDAVGNLLMEGATLRLNNADFQRDYRQDQPKKARFDTAYGLMFRGCLIHLVSEAYRRLGHHRKFAETSLDVVLEQGHKHSGDAERVFGELKAELDANGLPILRHFVKAKKDESDPLMAADFLAYTVYTIGMDAEAGRRSSPVPPSNGPSHRTGLTHLEFESDGLTKLKASIIERKKLRGRGVPAVIPLVVERRPERGDQ